MAWPLPQPLGNVAAHYHSAIAMTVSGVAAWMYICANPLISFDIEK